MSEQQRNSKTLRERALELFNKINLYEDDESLALNDQLLATRIYLLLLFLCLLSLLIFTGSSVQTIVVTIEAPTEKTFRQLSIDYPSTLVCPCSRISISYGEFMNFSPEYHQICRSDFIRSTWIASLFNSNASNTFPLDFRFVASSQFQMLSTFCQSSQAMISDVLQSFSASEIITSNTLFPSTFNRKMSALVDQMQAVTIADNMRIDRLLSLSISQNRAVSGLRTNFYMRNVPGTGGFASFGAIYKTNGFDRTNYSSITPSDLTDICICSSTFECHFPMALFNTTNLILPDSILWPYPNPIYFIPGIETGCVARTSLGHSTLECLFDQTCLNRISQSIFPFASVRPLNSSHLSKYNTTTIVEEIFNTLMIESWNEMSNFTLYYQSCAPQTCTYSYARRFSVIYMITTLIGLFGGLTVVIQMISPLFIKFILRRQKRPSVTPTENDEKIDDVRLGPKDLLIKCFQFVKTKITTFNLFKNTSMDIIHETYSTRLYILLLGIAFIILTIYLSIIRTTQTVTIDDPSLTTFEELYRDQSSTLTCPCEHLSTKYSELIFIQASYHQICSSVFLTNQWLNYWPLNSINESDPNVPYLSGQDFRSTGDGLFKLLHIFCDFAKETVDNALTIFNSTDFVTAQLLGRNEFNVQTTSLANQFIKTTSQSFKVIFELISNSIRLNQLLMFGNTNAVPRSRFNNGSYQLRYVARTFTKDNRTCSCDTSTQCSRQQGFYCRNTTCLTGTALPNRVIPGLNYACFPVDSILLSTLECFFNQSCVQMIIDNRLYEYADFYASINLTNITALDASRKSQYYPNTTLDTIIAQLFVENWTTSADYTAHFQQCQPKYCTYTFVERYKTIFVVTSVIGLVGGLTVIFEIFVPILMRILLHIVRRRRRYQDDILQLPLLRRLFHNLRQWNIYQEEATDGDHPMIATRLYVILLMIALIIITIFITFQQQTYSFSVTSPTENEFRLLNEEYSSTLSCPCSQLAVRYETFLQLSPTLHPICSSIFVTSNWSTALANKGDIWTTPDWFLLSTQFRLLTSMCQLSEQILQQSTYEFLSHQLVNTETLPLHSFQQQIDAALLLFIEHVPKEFRRTLAFIHQTFQSNQFADRYMSTWQITHSNMNESYILRWLPIRRNNSTCICAAGTSTCTRPLTFLNSSNRLISFPGFVDGCMAMYGLRQSTYECLFNQSCLNQLITLLNYPMTISALNASVSTMGTMIDELFVENWRNTSNYTSYYLQCAPSTCQYSYVDRNDVLYIITTVLGLYGGLTEALRVIVWHGIRILTKLFHRCHSVRVSVE